MQNSSRELIPKSQEYQLPIWNKQINLPIPQYVSEQTKCRRRNQLEEEGIREGHSPTGWRQRPLREMSLPVIHIKCRCHSRDITGCPRHP